jgi:hypothetical protein
MNVWSGLRVDASGDHQRRERVAAFVEGHGFEPACSPGALGALRDGRRAERCAVGEAEHQRTLVLVLCDPMLDEVIAEYRRDRRAAKAGRRLRLDRALLLIPRALDADQAGCEVDAVPRSSKSPVFRGLGRARVFTKVIMAGLRHPRGMKSGLQLSRGARRWLRIRGPCADADFSLVPVSLYQSLAWEPWPEPRTVALSTRYSIAL